MAEYLHLGLNPVRPDLDGHWRVLRSREASDGVVTYALMLEGGSLAEDWELDVLLPLTTARRRPTA